MSMSLSRTVLIVSVAIVVSIQHRAVAQDAHYWNLHYGPRASMLGGAVIGSVDDVSATFYNPGALAYATSLKLAVSTNVLESTRVSVVDGGGDGVELGSSRTGLRPTMVAGTIADSLGPNGVLSYSVLNRINNDNELRAALIAPPGSVPGSLDLYSISGNFRLETTMRDTWAGLTYSVPVGDHFGFGISAYGSVRNQRRRIEEVISRLQSPETGSTSVKILNVSTTTMHALAKVGAYFQSEAFSAGLTVTTPDVQVYGQGEIGGGASFTSNSPGDSLVSLAGTQKGVPARFKYPLAVGAGLGVPLGKAVIHASAEWFNALDRYEMVSGEPIEAVVPPGASISQVLPQEMSSVLNWGLGLEYGLKTDLRLFGSFHVNNSGLSDDIETPVMSLMTLDVKTATAGVEFGLGPAVITLGLGYGLGEGISQELSEIVGEIDEDFEATQRYTNLLGLFGFEIR